MKTARVTSASHPIYYSHGSTPIERLLERLDMVKPNGKARWTARCPSHTDKSSSLSVREADDGRVLVHCFAGCIAGDVVAAVGLEIKHLYPPRDTPYRPSSAPRPRTLAVLPDLPAVVFEHHAMRRYFKPGSFNLEQNPEAFVALANWLGDCIRADLAVR